MKNALIWCWLTKSDWRQKGCSTLDKGLMLSDGKYFQEIVLTVWLSPQWLYPSGMLSIHGYPRQVTLGVFHLWGSFFLKGLVIQHVDISVPMTIVLWKRNYHLADVDEIYRDVTINSMNRQIVDSNKFNRASIIICVHRCIGKPINVGWFPAWQPSLPYWVLLWKPRFVKGSAMGII